MTPESKHQRTGFQFDLCKLNVTILGAMIAFAITKPEWRSVLLCCPLVSAVLFIMWFHYAISIADGSRHRKEAREDPEFEIKRARRYSFAVAILSNFILLPFSAIALYFINSIPLMLILAGIPILHICTGLFLIWYRVQYHGMWLDRQSNQQGSKELPPED